ncbi:hypothetical protein GCM10009830_44810 [Glycomyces endophyticus]|uniref:Lipoprotein n=1 Tax=Glycomyces endophyticus TaxID=480996 RepID=A0ABN2HRY8_9ACTN
MRTAPVLLPLALLAAAAACTPAPEPAGPAAPPETAAEHAPESAAASEPGDVAVLNPETLESDDGTMVSHRTPSELILSEFSSARDLEWNSWGADAATAAGRIDGMFCETGCDGDAYTVTLVLCDVADGHYTRFGVFGDFPEFDDAAWAFAGPLYFGGAPADTDAEWSNGCEEPDPAERT